MFSNIFRDLWYTKDDYRVLVWKTSKNMVRKYPYIVVELPEINKTIIVNNLYWEATFLCDNIFVNWELLQLSKEDLLEKYSDIVSKIDFFDEESWANQIKLWLLQKKIYVRGNIDGDVTTKSKNYKESWRKKRISGLTWKDEYDLFTRYRDQKDIVARNEIFDLYRNRVRIWLNNMIIKNEYNFTKADIEDLYQECDLILLNAIEDFIKEKNIEKNFTHFIRYYFSTKMEEYLDAKMALGDIDIPNEDHQLLEENMEYLKWHLKMLSEKEQNKMNSINNDNCGDDEGIFQTLDKPEETMYVPSHLLDELSDESIDWNPDKQQILASLKVEIAKAISTLTPREADVVRLYFWLGWKSPMELEEIWEKFDLTRERVRQIKEKAIRRLKHTSRSKILKSYLG